MNKGANKHAHILSEHQNTVSSRHLPILGQESPADAIVTPDDVTIVLNIDVRIAAVLSLGDICFSAKSLFTNTFPVILKHLRGNLSLLI